jgi:hypothetical protein
MVMLLCSFQGSRSTSHPVSRRRVRYESTLVVEHEMLSDVHFTQDGIVVAEGTSKGTVRARSGVVPPAEVIAAVKLAREG